MRDRGFGILVVIIVLICVALSTTIVFGSDTMDACLRTSGVAPFMVQCDATRAWQPHVACESWSTTHFDWNFGDSDSATYVTGAKKNQDGGYHAAHVYEAAGTYVVTLTITHATDGDTSPVIETRTQTISVASENDVYASSTIFVAASGDDGNPGTEASPIKTWHEGRIRLLASSGPRRLLLKRGEGFVQTTSYTVGNVVGPFLIGSYGSIGDPVPFIDNTSGYPLLITSANPLELVYRDVKIVGAQGQG